MKKLFAIMLTLVLVFAFTGCEEDEEKEAQTGTEITFTLYNTTNITFKSLQISNAGKNDWSKNLITQDVKPLSEDESTYEFKVKIDLSLDELMFDLMGKDADGETYVFQYLDLSECDENGGNIVLALTEGGDGFASFSKPQDSE